ncbi:MULTISPECIES: DsbE family thiol:disulfide interchange protein [unclassified Hahella]|uniref:DsbE family thiol:disulfide interchange protein n=1 Tax=unclassified Hahella TaxID=2624107 RepID=UPI001C1EB439|nr:MULTISPECIES: DsbE family thiol:disulfide interchange protein [unclassified Hahella]MBU6955013.1 DsbE family thiol:disulfide interchange protein [Hahella sp. HN01]MDG9668126.1 DsbE family thiol:disulfide interchange protein [Hahella sp. CR1]
MKRLFLFVPLLAFVAVVILFNQNMDNDPSKLELARKDQPVPTFKLGELYNPGRELTPADLKGEPMLLNVWATWCPSCRVEHPYLLKLAKEYNVPIIGLNYKDDRDAAKKWLETLQDPYRFVIFDQEGRLGLDLGVYGAPETYVIDAAGVIRYRHVGVVNEKVWRETLAPMLRNLKMANANAVEEPGS